MPTYEYECRECGHRFELFQSIKGKPRRKCPECGGRVERLIGSGAAVIFRGSGFYQTDYRSPEYKRKAKAELDGGSKSGACSEAKPTPDKSAKSD